MDEPFNCIVLTVIEEALRAFQRSGEHLAIVRGAGGVEMGIVTLSDVLGALFLEVQS